MEDPKMLVFTTSTKHCAHTYYKYNVYSVRTQRLTHVDSLRTQCLYRTQADTPHATANLEEDDAPTQPPPAEPPRHGSLAGSSTAACTCAHLHTSTDAMRMRMRMRAMAQRNASMMAIAPDVGDCSTAALRTRALCAGHALQSGRLGQGRGGAPYCYQRGWSRAGPPSPPLEGTERGRG